MKSFLPEQFLKNFCILVGVVVNPEIKSFQTVFRRGARLHRWGLACLWLFCSGGAAVAADSQSLTRSGQHAQQEGRYTEAIVLYSQALTLDAANVHLLRLRAEAYQYLGNLERAEADLQTALQHEPQNPELLEGMGWLKLFQGDFRAAETWLRLSLVQEPDAFWARLNLAHALLLQLRENEAVALYCQLAQTPDGPAMGSAMKHDFALLRRFQIKHPQFDELVKKFTPVCGPGLILPPECGRTPP